MRRCAVQLNWQKGFSLLEVVLTLFALTVIASLTAVHVEKMDVAAQDQKILSDYKAVRDALIVYRDHFGYYPAQLNDLKTRNLLPNDRTGPDLTTMVYSGPLQPGNQFSLQIWRQGVLYPVNGLLP